MFLLPDAGIETIEDKLKTVLKLRSATVDHWNGDRSDEIAASHYIFRDEPG